jgi:hypothetical protein
MPNVINEYLPRSGNGQNCSELVMYFWKTQEDAG